MDAKDLAGHDRRNRESVEHVDEGLPGFDVGAPFAFIVEAVDWLHRKSARCHAMSFTAALTPCNVCTFMVSSQQEEILRVFDLVA